MIKRFIHYITHDIWQKDGKEPGTKEPWFIRPFRIIIYTIRGLGEHEVALRAAALTFFTLMSVVPVAALIFGIVKGFGLEANLDDYLYGTFPEYTVVIDNIMDFANNMLMRARGGVVASIGFVLLFWSVVQVFGNAEKAFNNIWEIKKQRSMARKFSDYVTIVVVAPILWLVSSGLVSYVRMRLEEFSGAWLVDIVFSLLSFVMLWFMFALVYYIMPNTRVKFKGALIAGILAGTIFQIFQIGYISIQSYLTKYNVIYGSFAALPLFLIWLQTSWMIMLIGAELSFAYQNISKYEQERASLHVSYDRRRKVMLAAMVIIIRHFLDNSGPVNSEQVAEELEVPVRIVRDVIFDLEKAGLVASINKDGEDKINYFVPARDAHEITVSDVIDGVESSTSLNASFVYKGSDRLGRVSDIIDNMKRLSANSPYNIYLTELTTDKDD